MTRSRPETAATEPGKSEVRVIHRSGWLRILTAALAAFGMAAIAEQKTLQVTVINGEGAFNDVKRGLARMPAVEVKDDDGRPLFGAKVVFQLPEMGAGGAFADGSRTLVAATDAQGRAAAPGLRPNKVEGRFTITVTASWDGRVGHAEIHQSNTVAGGDQSLQPNNHTKLKILIAVAGAAGGVAVAAARAGGSKSSGGASVPSPTTLSAGAVTIGGPR